MKIKSFKQTMRLSMLLLLAIVLSKKAEAQSGATCSSALSLTISPGQNTGWQTTSYDTLWYSFTAPQSNCYFTFTTSLVQKRKIKDVVYGVCGNFPNAYTLTMVNDSTYFLRFENLTVSGTYKLGMVFGLSGNCGGCANTGKYNLGFTEAAAPTASCTPTCTDVPVCEYICNPGFEKTSSIPQHDSQLNLACNWMSANAATPDLFSTSAPSTVPSGFSAVSVPNNFVGCENPLAGNNYAGFWAFWPPTNAYNEGMYTKLKTTLTAGHTYKVLYSLSLADSRQMNLGSVGCAFSPAYTPGNGYGTFGTMTTMEPINTYSVTRNGWTTLSHTYTATGNENYLIIGAINTIGMAPIYPYSAVTGAAGCSGPSFWADYYYIDEVHVIDVATFSLNVSPLCNGQASISVDPPGASTTYTWTSAPVTGSLSSVTGPSITVSPSVTTIYTVAANGNGTCGNALTTTISVNPLTTTSDYTFFCNGSNPVTIYANGLTTGLNYTWTSSPPTSSLSTQTGSMVTVSPSVATTYTVQAQLPGCSEIYTSTITITNNSPVITLVPNPQCINQPISVNISGGYINYLDYNADGAGDTWPFSYPAAGTYTVQIDAIDNDNTCYTIGYYTVSVINSGSAPSLTVNAAAICAGGAATLTVAGANTYTWSTGSNSSSITVTPSVTTVYTVTGKGQCGLTSTVTTTVTVAPNPTINISPASSTVCSGSNAVFNASGASTYTWAPCVSGCNAPTYTYTPSGNTTLTVSGTTSLGCVASKTVALFVLPQPTITVNSATICSGSNATLTASGASTYTWAPCVSGCNAATYTYTPSGNTTLTVSGTTSLGCVASKTVTLFVLPQPTITVNSATICSGSNATLTASGATTYTWNPGPVTGNSIVVTPTATTIYTVTGANGSCIGTQTVQVTVNPTPTLNITPTSATVCTGNNAILNASGSVGVNTFTWAPCTSGCNASVKSFSVTANMTVTLSATSPLGCIATKTVPILAVPKPTVTVNSTTICPGQSSTLTASGAGSYTWAPGSSTVNPVVVTPTATTVYTVTGLNAGCYINSVQTATVTVSPSTSFSVTTSVSNNYPITGSAVTVSATVTPAGTYTYNWSPISANTASATFTPTDNAVYSCVVTDRCGNSVSSSLCISLESTLCATSSNTVINSATYTGLTTSLSNQTITITGTLTIGGGSSVILDHCIVKMGTNAKIVVDPTSYFTISSTKLFSCEGMWYGIEAQSSAVSSATIDLKNASIEDAYQAITADNASTNVSNKIISGTSSFNKNYTDISIKNALSGSGTYPLTMTTSSLTSNASTTSPGNSLKCSSFYSPVVRKRSYAGVVATNANVVDILNSNNNADFNNVKNKDYGLYFTNTNANVYNINFSDFDGSQSTSCNITTHVCTTTYYGVAIRSESSGYVNVKPTSSPTTGALTFTNVAYGVLANATTSVDVQYADFRNPGQYVTPLGQTGIGRNAIIATNATSLFRANHNTITQTFDAISSAYTTGPAGSFILSASENTISAGTGTLSNAISVQASVSFSPAANSMRVNGNTITNAGNGIYINTIKNGLRVSSNTITMLAATGTFAGIKLTGTENATIDANAISSTATTNANLRGIYLQLSPSCYTQCNNISTVGQSVVFEGNCSSPVTGFNNNIMTNANDGLVLKTNGIIGAQGATGGGTPSSSGNQWLGTFTNSKTLVMDAGSSAQYSNLIVKNNTNEYPQPQSLNKTLAAPGTDNYGTSIYNSPASIFTVTSANPNCPTPQSTGLRTAQADTADAAYMKAVKDTALYNLLGGPEEGAVIIEETREINRAYVYNVLASGYNTNHAGLLAFYAQQSDSIVAHYHAIDSLLQDGNYYAAQTKNAQVITATQIQYNQQKVNEALTRYGTDPQAGFTPDELDELMAFANSCPLKQGPAVYQARTLLSVLFNNALTFTENCAFESKGERKNKAIKGDKTENSFTLYPNPNNGVMYLNYTLSTDASVTIYDISGRVLYQHLLSSQNKLLQIKADLANGVYFYSVKDMNNNVLQTDKLIIMK